MFTRNQTLSNVLRLQKLRMMTLRSLARVRPDGRLAARLRARLRDINSQLCN